jgi:hypothetical protein
MTAQQIRLAQQIVRLLQDDCDPWWVAEYVTSDKDIWAFAVAFLSYRLRAKLDGVAPGLGGAGTQSS